MKKTYIVKGEYYHLGTRVSAIRCYKTEEPNYTTSAYDTFTRYWVELVLSNSNIYRISFDDPYNANQCFLFYKHHCGIELKDSSEVYGCQQ